MITKIFLFQLLITFLTGSCWIYFTVFLGGRFGSMTAGFIGGLPSTALLSFFFIGYTQSPEIASSATTVFPIAIAISCLFLVVYASIARHGFLIALLTALVFWIISSAFLVFFHFEDFLYNLAIYVVIIIPAYFLMGKTVKKNEKDFDKKGVSAKNLVIRSLIGGFVVMMTVLIAKAGGTVLGGIFAAFPAMFISILTISYKTHGIDFSKAMAKPLMMTGMITLIVFVVSVKYLYLYTSLFIGTLLAVFLSAISAYLTYRFILVRIK